MDFKGRSFIAVNDFSKEEMLYLFKKADEMLPLIETGSDLCKGKILSALFFEPSTRTRLSFESAMNRLGGSVLGFSDAGASSVAKGETIADTIRTVEGYADVIVMRHPFEGSAKIAADYAKVPVINGGDGGHQHPTQTLLDIYTILKEKEKIKGLNVAVYGDLKYGRATQSIAQALALFGANLYFVAPKTLEMPERITERLKKQFNTKIVEEDDLSKIVSELDVIYASRIQKERFQSEDEFLKVRGGYVLTKELLEKAKKDAIIMHPLPRVDEISYEVDADPRAKYFRQSFYGVPIRMALIALLLGRLK